jgi:hypothetical protein
MKKNKHQYEVEVMPGVFLNPIDVIPLMVMWGIVYSIVLLPFYLYHKYIKKTL